MTNTKSMLLVKGTIAFENVSKATFKMVPLTKDCPYLEAIYHPIYHGLGIVGKYKKKEYVMMPTIDKFGVPIMKDGKPLQERRMMDSWHEYLLMTKDEVIDFIGNFAVNAESFNYKQFFPSEEVAPKNEVVLKTTVTEKEAVEV
jgi:hypothetical protein